MAQEDRGSLAEWYEALRRQVPVIRRHGAQWLAAAREEPILIWETAAVRYAAYGLGGFILFWIVSAMVGMFAPSPPATARPTATTADFHVVCAAPQCGRHFVVNRKFGFSRFPVGCPGCGERTGMRARRCNSDTCRGRWVAPHKSKEELYCPQCGRQFD